ncbi:MAG: hypothetical protein JEZ11_21235 [Desulfobacterales bacterium]|nr:hypothetical protein [Desulfobacterales bacterium]
MDLFTPEGYYTQQANSIHFNSTQEGTVQRILLLITLIAFLALTGIALWHHGYWGIVEPHFQSFGAAQVLADLVIALSLFLVWLWRDARTSGRNPWPWILVTFATGSIGPMIYLLIYKTGKTP